VSIPAGGRVVVIWASANRDERRWSRADELLITREPHRHVSFGEGIHHCLGAPLARMEARIVLEEALPLLTDYHPTGPVERRFTPSERTIVRLPAAVRWR
jgi:cytochrome P450